MANASIEVFDGSKWVPITSRSLDERIKEGEGKPSDDLKAYVYFDTDTSTDKKKSEKIYFFV